MGTFVRYQGMRRLLAVLSIAMAVAPISNSAGGTPAAAASTTAYVQVIAADSRYVVYVPLDSAGSLGPNIIVLDSKGNRATVGRTSPHRGTALTFSLAGSMLTAYPYGTQGFDNQTVYWWDLGGHTSGRSVLNSDDIWIGSAPGGFVYEAFNSNDPESSTYFRATVADHTTVQLQTPYPGNLEEVVSGPTGFVAIAGGDATPPQMTFVPYSGKRSTQLKPPSLPLSNLAFPEMSSGYVTFKNEGYDGERHDGVLVPLDGGKSIVAPWRGYQIGRRITYGQKHPVFRSSDGTIIKSTLRGRVVAGAFRSAIVTNRAQTKLLAVAGPTATPRRLFG